MAPLRRRRAPAVEAVIALGQSLATAVEPALRATPGAELSLCRELAAGTLRFRPRLEAILRRLLNRPLASNAQDIHALLLVGLYQLEELKTPAHVAVSNTVEAARILNRGWACSLVNGVLRNHERNRQPLTAGSEAERFAHPQWLIEALRNTYPDCWQQILEAGNQRPPMTLRVNRLRTSRDDYQRSLHDAGIIATNTKHADCGIRLETPVDVDSLPGFAAGLVSVQDEAAQFAAPLLDVQPGQRVLDACAAPGGKAAHVLERQPTLAELVAIDSEPQRVERLRGTLRRLGLAATTLCADALDRQNWWDRRPFDRILLDAPCSATGVIRRHPDIKSLRAETDIARFAQTQTALLRALWPMLGAGGKLLYVTCSLMTAENSQVVEAFLNEQRDASALPIAVHWGRPLGAGRQTIPNEDHMDGFFYALLAKD
ncbi:MAG: 16S rRNA (cytosine(967)-C(5))-methyltransferase RsmB [Gammaproteobacteria bacterium]